jgi:nicotinamide phosphoribosyltransferase
MKENLVMLADSYKYSQPFQYPKDTVSMFDYFESRGGEYPSTVFFGLQYIIMKYLTNPITIDDVNEAAQFASMHGEPFNYEGSEYVVNKHKGYLPVSIKAVKEGSVVTTGNVLMTVESTDPKVYWIVGFLETLLMKVWYPSAVATKSYFIKKMLADVYNAYSDNKDVNFAYCNFGDRGSTTVEAAAIGGVAHSTQFLGTDNFNSLRYARFYYNSDISAFSIPASEHSSVTSWGKDNEFDMIMNHLETFKSYQIIACVLDSYDIYNATDRVTSGEFKSKIESDEYPIFVMRPDSGDAVEVISKMLDIIDKNNVKYSLNSKGLKVMNKYKIIYGDGITPSVMKDILMLGIKKGFAPDNFVFGSGGDLMQNLNRDTSKYAIKCSFIEKSDGTGVEVFKSPITDKGKSSKKGKISLFKINNEYKTLNINEAPEEAEDMLLEVFKNGKIINKYSLDQIREQSTK